MRKNALPAWAVLTIITLIAALALGGTYEATKGAIAKRTAEEAEATRSAILPAASEFEQLADAEGLDAGSFYEGTDDADQVCGYTASRTVQGFGGEVEVTVGTDPNGVITGVRVGGPNFSETAGLGAKAKEPAFYSQFTGKTCPVELSKNGGEIDAITSATITSSAVVNAVNDAVKAISQSAGLAENAPGK